MSGLFDHVTIRVADREASVRFYGTVLSTLGRERNPPDPRYPEWDDFSLAAATEDHPITTGLHVGFFAGSAERVRAFWRAGVDAGYRDDGPPGPRPQYGDDYHGGFVLDPDGNSAEAVNHENRRALGQIDHLWIRVTDIAASRAFYATIAPFAGIELGTDTAERVQFRGDGGTFSLVAGGEPTRNVHLAFPAPDHATVEGFHAAALAAGHRDHGEPGERPVYHPGYYGAFVLDPDGNNVELVDHGRA